MTVVVIDVGTSSVRVSAVERDGSVSVTRRTPMQPHSPAPGRVEFDPMEIRDAVMELTALVVDATSEVEAIGVTAQRACAIAWDPTTGETVGPGLGWQDQRTADRCAELMGMGHIVLTSQTASKAEWLVQQAPESCRDRLLVGPLDAWVVWNLTEGERHVFDPSSAWAAGWLNFDLASLNEGLIAALGLGMHQVPELVATSGVLGTATAVAGAPPIASLVGDQQSSMAGQGVVVPGVAKVTMGTGAMANVFLGESLPDGVGMDHGSFPMAAFSIGSTVTWGYEAMMVTAGHNIEWWCDNLGVFTDGAALSEAAATVATTDGVVWVPSLLGLGSPYWDLTAAGALMGVHRSTTPAHIARAVLEGLACRVADLVDALQADAGVPITVLRADGGMSASDQLCSLVASASGRVVEAAPQEEMTTVGAAKLAGLAIGWYKHLADLAEPWEPRARFAPGAHQIDRDRFAAALQACRDLQ